MTAFDQAERRAWAGRAHAYATSFASLCAHTVPALLDVAGVSEGLRVLDVGTGTGTTALAAARRGAQVTAVDAEPGMVAFASQAGPGVDVLLAALPDLPFADETFDVVVGNFVVNHVGQPRAAVVELRRVTRRGGRVALTLWAAPPAAGQALLGQAVRTAGVTRPADVPMLAVEDDFPRTEQGLAALLREAGLGKASCGTRAWTHRVSPEQWWSGPAAGVSTIGQIIASQPPVVIAQIKARYDILCAEFIGPDGMLRLPHAALIASGRA